MIEDKELKQMNELWETKEELSNFKKEIKNNNEKLNAKWVKRAIISYGYAEVKIVKDKSWNRYFLNRKDHTLKISKSVDPVKAAKILAKAMYFANKSERGLEINHYETDDWKTLQVDYNLSPIDVDLISDTKKLVGVHCYKLVDWLNEDGGYWIYREKPEDDSKRHKSMQSFGDSLWAI